MGIEYMRKKTRVVQKQSVRQNVNVIVQTAPPRRRKRRSQSLPGHNIFDAITSRNLGDSRKREGVARAVERYGQNIHNVMPYEALERIAGGTSSIVWNRNEPERVLPRLKYERPADVANVQRPFLKSRVQPEGGGKSYVVEEPDEPVRGGRRSERVKRRIRPKSEKSSSDDPVKRFEQEQRRQREIVRMLHEGVAPSSSEGERY